MDDVMCKHCRVPTHPGGPGLLLRKCRVADAVDRHRSDYTKPDPTTGAEKRLQAVSEASSAPSDGSTVVWPTRDEQRAPTSGQGDDYPLEYYEDGHPKLPTCLDRRPVKLELAA